MDEDIYGPSITHLKGKTARHKIKRVDPINITSVPKTILDTYNYFTIFYDLVHINEIGFLNTISCHIIFATGTMIKNLRIKNVSDGITQIRKLYL